MQTLLPNLDTNLQIRIRNVGAIRRVAPAFAATRRFSVGWGDKELDKKKVTAGRRRDNVAQRPLSGRLTQQPFALGMAIGPGPFTAGCVRGL